MPCGQFPANRPNEPKSQSDIASRPLPKSPASSSQFDVVPQMIIRSSNVRPREFAIGDAKRLLQQYRHKTDVSRRPLYRRYWRKSGSDSDIVKPTRLTHYGHVCLSGSTIGRQAGFIHSTDAAAGSLIQSNGLDHGFELVAAFGGCSRRPRSLGKSE
jgi:hypothetical protein